MWKKFITHFCCSCTQQVNHVKLEPWVLWRESTLCQYQKTVVFGKGDVLFNNRRNPTSRKALTLPEITNINNNQETNTTTEPILCSLLKQSKNWDPKVISPFWNQEHKSSSRYRCMHYLKPHPVGNTYLFKRNPVHMLEE